MKNNRRFTLSERSKSKGFTLVELLVVISIVAILATIGMAVFAGAQKNARDGKRLADIDALSKSLEASKDYTTSLYVNGLTTDFPNGIPVDAKGTTNYCILTSTTQGVISDPAAWTSGCPTSPTAWAKVDGTAFAASTKSWKICAVKENGGTVYCKHSLQQ